MICCIQVTKVALFVQPKVDSYDICTLSYCVNTNSSHVKSCWDNIICDGCTRSIIRAENIDKKLQCPHCQANYRNKAEYLVILSQKTDFARLAQPLCFNLADIITMEIMVFQKMLKTHNSGCFGGHGSQSNGVTSSTSLSDCSLIVPRAGGEENCRAPCSWRFSPEGSLWLLLP